MTQRLLPDPDLDALIQKLNTAAREEEPAPSAAPDAEPPAESTFQPLPPEVRWPLPAWSEEGSLRLTDLLVFAREAHASDLLLVPDRPPIVRIHGGLEPAGDGNLSGAVTGLLCGALVPVPRRLTAETLGAVDFVVTRKGLGRFRCNVHRERERWSAAIRVLPETAPDTAALNLPASLGRFADLEYGLILVTGPTGCGKSTTLAALMKRILARRRVHVITIEDPVEYEHPHGDAVVEHIEIGRDAPSFAHALRAALRQDPDVLLIGEMRDPESIEIAITAAETGHLVLSTLHTGDAPGTINRIVDSYPAAAADTVRVQLSVSLAGIVSQQLLPRKDGAGRVPAVEILIATPAVRNLIRQGKIAHIRAQFAFEQSAGMLELDRSLAMLVRSGLVDRSAAQARAGVPEEFDQLVRLAGDR